jgi:hypothetical protein
LLRVPATHDTPDRRDATPKDPRRHTPDDAHIAYVAHIALVAHIAHIALVVLRELSAPPRGLFR